MDLTCPVRTVDLPGVLDLGLRGLIVVVGPNSSGKTQLLHDLNEAVCGRDRQFVVVSGVVFAAPPPLPEYLRFLLERGTIRQSGPAVFLKQSLQYGADQGAGSFDERDLNREHHVFSAATEKKSEGFVPRYVFLEQLGPLSCSVLFLKNRLTLMDACGTFDHRSAGPSRTLQALYRNKEAKTALHKEIARVFHRAVWVDNTRHAQLVLRVSDSPYLPAAEDRLEPELMETYRTIETEGDGLRSYAAICTTLLLEQRPLCLIDEPEMCLHPPQSHAMGRFIGKHASEETCTVVATHSGHVLRGILETNPRAHVIRLTRVGGTFRARTLTSELLEQATSKPRSRTEAILEGLLSDAVVLCEAEGDRLVYESTYRTFGDRRLDIRFVPSEGTGGFADPLRLYQALDVPSTVVADLDFLAKDGELKKVLIGLGIPASDATDLCKRARESISYIRSCISRVDPADVQKELEVLARDAIELAANEDAKLRGKLQQLINRLSRLHHLQVRGIEAIPESYDPGRGTVSLRSDVSALLCDLQQRGLFLVPVGELESWLPKVMKGQSREDKSKWAMLAAEKIDDVGEREDDVWGFIRTVYGFLLKRLKMHPKASDEE